MTKVERLAGFAVSAAFSGIFQVAVLELKIRKLDALGCARLIRSAW